MKLAGIILYKCGKKVALTTKRGAQRTGGARHVMIGQIISNELRRTTAGYEERASPLSFIFSLSFSLCSPLTTYILHK